MMGKHLYSTDITNLADDVLDPFQFRLYAHYRRNGNRLDGSVREIAKQCRMSVTKVVEARNWLHENGWINCPLPTQARFVYLVRQCNTMYYKIGVAANLEKRLAQLHLSVPHGVDYVASCQPDNAREYESHLHRILSDERINGEWFELTNSVALSIASLIDGNVELT